MRADLQLKGEGQIRQPRSLFLAHSRYHPTHSGARDIGGLAWQDCEGVLQRNGKRRSGGGGRSRRLNGRVCQPTTPGFAKRDSASFATGFATYRDSSVAFPRCGPYKRLVT